MTNEEIELNTKTLITDFMNHISFGVYDIKETGDLKVEKYDNNKLNYSKDFLSSCFINLKLVHKENSELTKKVCLYATISKELLLEESYVSFYEDKVTTPIKLVVDNFNAKTKLNRLDKALPNKNNTTSNKIKI